FSSRRRHTRSKRDWSSDVCSSDLNMIDGFVDGIKSMGSKVADAAKGAVSKAADFLKFWSPAKKGEGRYITHWGANMIDGFLDGVESQYRNIENVIGSVTEDRKSTRLNSSHVSISYAVFCLKKKTKTA